MFKMRCGIPNAYILDITMYKMHVYDDDDDGDDTTAVTLLQFISLFRDRWPM